MLMFNKLISLYSSVHLRSQSVDWRRQEPRIHHVSHDYVPDDDVGLSRFEGFEYTQVQSLWFTMSLTIEQRFYDLLSGLTGIYFTIFRNS